MISRFFIDRPVLANVLALLMVVIGAVALTRLPVSQYPNVVPPTVVVSARYPGASAETLMETVALPIEQQVNGVQGMLYMQSASTAEGGYTLVVTFEIGTDLNAAQVLVQNRVAGITAALPQPVQAQGVTVQQKSTAILQIVALEGHGRYSGLFLANYATINLVDELARLPGVGNVAVFGAGQYAMPVWFDPQLLRARGLVAQDVIQSIQSQSQQVGAGQVGAPPAAAENAFQYSVAVSGRLSDPAQFADIIVKADDPASGRITRVKDVGRVELGAQSYGQAFALDGQPSAGIAVFQAPGANALQVAGEVRAKMAELARRFPEGLGYSVPFDTTVFVAASIREVYRTLIEAGILVLAVILVFLQDWRAALVPATTVPVTIIGAFAGMAALGFTINLATLFAIVLSIGIVVDDAIVVVEGASHHLGRGLSGRDAAIRAMRELFGPIIGITLVLMAVFLPASFVPGLTGRLYAQFALVIAVTALLSAVNAATLKPMQCANWLRPPVPVKRRNPLYRGFDAAYVRLERGYARLVGATLRHSSALAGAAVVLCGLAVAGFARLPTGFLPLEDQGYMLVSVQLPSGAPLRRTEAVLDRIGKAARELPDVRQTVAIAGVSAPDNNAAVSSAGVVYVMLKDWKQRGPDGGLRGIYESLNRVVEQEMDASGLVLVPPAIQGIGNSGGFTMMVELPAGDPDWAALARLSREVVREAGARPEVARAFTPFKADAPQLRVRVDRVKAEALHVPLGNVFDALESFLGSSYVGQVSRSGRVLQVQVQADGAFRASPDDIGRLWVRNAAGGMVPLGTLVEVSHASGPSLITLYNQRPAATVLGAAAPGYSSGQALDAMDRAAADVLPAGAAADWSAMSFQERLVGGQIYAVFGLALLLVYMVLAGQYESWTAPLAVLLSVPLSLLGPVAVLHALGVANNLYTQIGLVLLIALSAKNAILIVEVALEQRAAGMPIVDCALDAARRRFRPILMTSLAFILGVLPLVFADGAGANARRSIGIAVCSGMTASTCLAVLFVPSFFVVAQRFSEWRSARAGGGSAASPPMAVRTEQGGS